MTSDSSRDVASPPRGVLRPASAEPSDAHRRVLPAPALRELIEHYWGVSWSLSEPTLVETLPHPSVHLVFESGAAGARAEVAGVPRGRFSRTLSGDGWVFGVKFRPAMFEPVLARDLATLTDRVVPLTQVFGAEGEAWARATFTTPDFEARTNLADAFLTTRLAGLRISGECSATRDLVEHMAATHSLLRVESAAERLGVDERTLQRRFRRYVGVSPKWVILRYRLHEAAERLHSEQPPGLAQLAAELGYADQAHFARDFSRVIGRTPREFAAAAAAQRRA
ncbi:MAG: helix-turn-helix domain-containing protein [Polyangiaceae bacterium]